MNPLTYWAKTNKDQARVWIFVINVLLGVLAVSTGQWLSFERLHFSEALRNIGVLMGLTGFLFYPFRNLYLREEKKKYLTIRKTADGFLIAGSVLMFLFMGNHFQEYFNAPGFSSLYAGSPAPASSLEGFACQGGPSPTPLVFQKIGSLGIIAKILLFALILVLGIALAYLIIILGCGISCAGYETAGALFMLGGVIWLIPAVILGGHHLFGEKIPSKNGLLFRKIVGIIGTLGVLLTTIMLGLVLAQVNVILLLISAAILGLCVFYIFSLFKKGKSGL